MKIKFCITATERRKIPSDFIDVGTSLLFAYFRFRPDIL